MSQFSISGLLTARFILRLRSFSQDPRKLGGGTTHSQELSSLAAASNARGGGRSRGGFSLADEFGDDPLHMVFRAAGSATATTDSSEPGMCGDSRDKEADAGFRRAAAVEELMGHMRRAGESQSEWDHGGTTMGGTESHVDWDDRRTTGTGTDIEAGDGVTTTSVNEREADTTRTEARSTVQRAGLDDSTTSKSVGIFAPPCGTSSAGVSGS